MKTLVTTILTTIILSCPAGVLAQESEVPENQNCIFAQNNDQHNAMASLRENSECNLTQAKGGVQQALKSSQLDLETDDRDRDSSPRERRTRKDAKSNGIGGYAGATFGVFFPDVDEDRDIFTGNNTDVNDGFGGSIFAGAKFNKYLATDLEFSSFVGDIDSDLDVDDESYTVTSVFLNPRFILPLNDKDNSLDLYLSPGIGISTFISRVEDEVGDFDSTTTIEDDTRFTWQIKGGASVPISRRFSILGQVRYASQTGDDAIDYFATETGVEFDF